MMQDYNLDDIYTSAAAASALLPSEQVVKNILDFARSYQAVEVEGLKFGLFLN